MCRVSNITNCRKRQNKTGRKCETRKAGGKIEPNPIILMTTLNIYGLTILVKGVCQSWSRNKIQLFVYRKGNLNTTTEILSKYQWESVPCNPQFKESNSIYINLRKNRHQTFRDKVGYRVMKKAPPMENITMSQSLSCFTRMCQAT